MGKRLTKDQIFKLDDLKTEEVDVPEWGGSVLVRGLTGRERDEFESSLLDQSGKRAKLKMQNARARLVYLSVVNDDGSRMFDEMDVWALGEKNAAALDRIYDVAARLSGISDADMEELAGKSSATTGGASPSA